MTVEKNYEFLNIIERENLTQEDTTQKHQREIKLFTEILNLFTSGFNYIGSFNLKEDNEAEYIWLLIVTRCFHSIRCSINLILKGYYSQAMAILRTGTEDWFICGTCKDNDNVRNYLLRDEGERLNYSQLAKEMEEKGEKGATSVVYQGDYHYQSKFAHVSGLSLRVLYNVNTKKMSSTPIYNESLFLSCAESLVRVSLKMAEYMLRVILYLDVNRAKAWEKENSQKIEAAVKWSEDLRKKIGNDKTTGGQ